MIHIFGYDTKYYIDGLVGTQPVYHWFLMGCRSVFGRYWLDSVAILQFAICVFAILYMVSSIRFKNKYLTLSAIILLMVPVWSIWNLILTEPIAYSLMLMAFGSINRNKFTYTIFAILAALTRTQMAFLFLPFFFNKKVLIYSTILVSGYLAVHGEHMVLARLRPMAAYLADQRDIDQHLVGSDAVEFMTKAELNLISFSRQEKKYVRIDQDYDYKFNKLWDMPHIWKAYRVVLNHWDVFIGMTVSRILGLYEDMRTTILLIPLFFAFYPQRLIRYMSVLNLSHILLIQTFSSLWHNRYAFYVQDISILLILVVLNEKIKGKGKNESKDGMVARAS